MLMFKYGKIIRHSSGDERQLGYFENFFHLYKFYFNAKVNIFIFFERLFIISSYSLKRCSLIGLILSSVVK